MTDTRTTSPDFTGDFLELRPTRGFAEPGVEVSSRQGSRTRACVMVEVAELAERLDGIVPGLSVKYEKPVDLPRGVGAVVIDPTTNAIYVRDPDRPNNPRNWRELNGNAASHPLIGEVDDDYVADIIREHGEDCVKNRGVEL